MAPERLILRDHLALDRTRLANERTLLTYVRTAIILIVSGVSLIKLFGAEHRTLLFLGYALVPVGVLVGALGFVRFRQTDRRIAAEEQRQLGDETQ